MLPCTKCVLMTMAVLAGAPASGREACQERVLSLRFSPQAGRANNWCWAASGQMIMELLGEEPDETCQCRQAEQVLGVTGCCVAPGSCFLVEELPAACDRPGWPAFVERPDRYAFDYSTTCDDLPGRQDDEACQGQPLGWAELTAELCVGRPVIASLRARGGGTGHTVVVKGFSSWPVPRVLVLDPRRLCPHDRHCEGELDESFWLSYDEYAAGWDGLAHWVDFFAIRKREAESVATTTAQQHPSSP